MEPLQPIPQCIDCLMSLAKNAAAFAAREDAGLAAKAESAARKILQEAKANDLSSPQIANRIIREIKRLTGVQDPYADFKAREMKQAQKIYRHLKNRVGDSLRSRVSLAILGNSFDFFKNPEKASAEIASRFRKGVSFFYDHTDRLEKFLKKKPAAILYLSDNAGEIYFDLPLYEYLTRHSRQTILVVKGGPALNDLTRAELRRADLENQFEHMADTGTDGAGIDWEHVSGEFIDLINSADLVLSKGMANFETLYPKRLKPASFYLFKIKCAPVQNYIQAPADSFLAIWKDGASKR